MRKLKLDLDALAVESFAASADAAAPGTVRANDESNARCNSDVSCGNTCVDSCGICGTYLCVPTEDNATCNFYCTVSGGTSCNAPCGYSCDGSPSCNNQTCVATCQGNPTCGLNTCDYTCNGYSDCGPYACA